MKNKILKTCFVGCLATCLTLTGIFAFTPLGASAQASSSNSNLNNNLNNSSTSTTESTGLITPRADDPVLFTTENGLEIKYGNATINGLTSGALSGYPYITTVGSSTYNWVLIGIGDPDESLTIAGNTIKSDSNYSKRCYFGFSSSFIHSEIPAGCGLFLSNTVLGSAYKVQTSGAWANYPDEYVYYYNFGSHVSRYNSYASSEYGLDSLNLITTKVTYYYNYVDYNPRADEGTAECLLFPLSIYHNYLVSNYLNSNELRNVGSAWWLRDAYNPAGTSWITGASRVTADGSVGAGKQESCYDRPAFIMSLV